VAASSSAGSTSAGCSTGRLPEADGLLKYQGRAEAIAELRRDRLLREAGYEVVHFTWQELFTEPTRVVARIRQAFAHGRPVPALTYGAIPMDKR